MISKPLNEIDHRKITKESTLKRKNLIKNLATSKTIMEAGIKAGYSPKGRSMYGDALLIVELDISFIYTEFWISRSIARY